MSKLPPIKHEPGCTEKHCFFYSQNLCDCIYTGVDITDIVAYLERPPKRRSRRKASQLTADLFLNNDNCPEKQKAAINEWKMNKLLLADID